MQNFTKRSGTRDNRDRYTYYQRESGKTVKIDLHHRDGGMNYFSGQGEKRGIEISVSMVEVSEGSQPGSRIESSMPMDSCNARYLVLEAPRYNKGKLERIAQALDADMPKLAETWEADTAAGKKMLIEIAEAVERSGR